MHPTANNQTANVVNCKCTNGKWSNSKCSQLQMYQRQMMTCKWIAADVKTADIASPNQSTSYKYSDDVKGAISHGETHQNFPSKRIKTYQNRRIRPSKTVVYDGFDTFWWKILMGFAVANRTSKPMSNNFLWAPPSHLQEIFISFKPCPRNFCEL